MVYAIIGILILFIINQIQFQSEEKHKKVLCISIFLVMFILSAAKNIGTDRFGDLTNYKNMYYAIKDVPWNSIFTSYSAGNWNEVYGNIGFAVFEKFVSIFGVSAEFWLGVVAFVVAFATSYFIYNHSENPFISALMMFALYMAFTMTGIRQALAISMCMIAYDFIIKKKLIWYVFFCVLAWSFHSSAILFAPAYFIAKQKITKKQFFYVIFAVVTAVFFSGLYRNLIVKYAWNERYLGYSTSTSVLNWSGFIIQGLIIVACLYNRNRSFLSSQEKWLKTDAFLNCMIIGLCLQTFTVVIAESFRISYYYSICCIGALPNALADVDEGMLRNKQANVVIIAGVFILYILWTRPFANFTYF